MGDSERFKDDYWVAGQRLAVAADQRFSGASGLKQLAGPNVFSAPRPSLFRARLSRLQLGHLAIEAFEATTHRGLLHPGQPDQCRVVTITLLTDGWSEILVDEQKLELLPGRVAITDDSRALEYVTDDRFKVLRVVTDSRRLPRHSDSTGFAPPSLIRRSPLGESLFSLVGDLLVRPQEIAAMRRDHLGAALAELHAGVLAEANRIHRDPESPEGLRGRMRDHIDLHLHESDLDPGGVAEAVGISLRRAQLLFRDGDHSLAREIRERRLDAVARDLSHSHDRETVEELATRWGFSGPDVLTRLFRHRYGVTPATYRASRDD